MRFFKPIVFTGLILVVIGLAQCGQPGPNIYTKDGDQPEIYTDDEVAEGEVLVAQHCQSCHGLPAPSLLTKSIWKNNVLPLMGQYLGLQPTKPNTPRIEAMYRPATAVINDKDWRLINAYYITKAPEELQAAKRVEPVRELPFFEVTPTPSEWVSTQAFTSYVKIDQSVKPHRLIVADGLNNKLLVLNNKGQTIHVNTLTAAVVDLNFQSNNILASVIGFDLTPNDIRVGSIQAMSLSKNGVVAFKDKPLFERLNRPLSVDLVDLDQDGKKDYLINQYGNMTGKLSWFGGADKAEHVLREKPGCVKAIVDNNNTGKLPDVWALFAQGDEGVFLFENKGGGVFEEKKLLSFPPSYGSVTFDLLDFNGDGFKDIVYACGDNADHSQILKPYHGVYIYLNDGKNNFNQKYFYPINGCNKVIAKDFDGDGDLDMAAISAYPSEKAPWEGFIYFENVGGGLNFKAYALPASVKFTHSMTMDTGDIDGDGKPDILIGGGFAAKDANSSDKQALYLLLKNITKK